MTAIAPNPAITERRQQLLDSVRDDAYDRLSEPWKLFDASAGWIPVAVQAADEILEVSPDSAGQVQVWDLGKLTFGVNGAEVNDWGKLKEIRSRYTKAARSVCRYCGASKPEGKRNFCDECSADKAIGGAQRSGRRNLIIVGVLAAALLWFIFGVVAPQVFHDLGQMVTGVFQVVTGTSSNSALQTPEQARNSHIAMIVVWSCVGVSVLTYLSMWKLSLPRFVKVIIALITPVAVIWLIGWLASRFLPRLR